LVNLRTLDIFEGEQKHNYRVAIQTTNVEEALDEAIVLKNDKATIILDLFLKLSLSQNNTMSST